MDSQKVLILVIKWEFSTWEMYHFCKVHTFNYETKFEKVAVKLSWFLCKLSYSIFLTMMNKTKGAYIVPKHICLSSQYHCCLKFFFIHLSHNLSLDDKLDVDVPLNCKFCNKSHIGIWKIWQICKDQMTVSYTDVDQYFCVSEKQCVW